MTKKTGLLLLLVFILLFSFVQSAAAIEYHLERTDTYKIRHSITVSNDTAEISRNIYITVPLMDETQPVYQYLLGQRYNIEPLLIFTNASKQLFALFNIRTLQPHSSIQIDIDYFVDNSALSYDIDATKLVSQDISAVDGRYIMHEKNIESDSDDLLRYADEFLRSGETNFYSLAKKAFADVNLYMTYGNRSDGRTGALAALQTGVGNCVDYAQLYTALLRAMGIPARLQTGYVYEPAIHSDENYINTMGGYIELSNLAHTWVEFYVPEAGWIIADPTFTYTVNMFGTEQKLVKWDYFATIPTARKYFYFSSTAAIDDIRYEYMGAPINVKVEPKLYLDASYLHFKDIEGHWAASEINSLYDKGLISGIGDHTFLPDKQVTRAEMAAVLHRIINPEAAYHGFTDITPNAWYAPYIGAIYSQGLMVGDGKQFRPDDTLTRAEMAAILCRLMDLRESVSEMPFEDVASNHWAAGAISTLYEAGIVSGKQANAFAPGDIVTRAEMAVFISRALNYHSN